MKKVILILVSVLVSCSKDSGNDEKEKPFFNLIVLANEGGTVNSSGGGYVEGTEITITASPNEGYEFDGWTGTTNSNENPLTILLLKNQKITANFKGKIYVDPINGITVKCPYAIIGDVAEINGKSYTVVNSTSKIREIIDDFDENTCACTSQVERMTGLFEDSPVYENIEDWDTSNVENMNGMFSFSSNFNQDLGYWNTSNVTSMSYMFEGTEFNQDI